LAVKIVRQEKSIVLLGVPTSAAALAAGRERAPAALRAAGLAARLTEAGFTVADHGDCTTRAFQVDDEHPRARNVRQVLATLEELRPKVEMAVKSGALPVVLGGDASIVLATIAGARRYYRNVSLIFLDRDADLKEPATTASGSVDGMVISHVLGRGAPELVRFWGEPPLVRAPDVALFGIAEPEAAEQRFMEGSPLRRYLASDVKRLGGRAAAEAALERVHGRAREFVLHLDLKVIAAEDFHAANAAGAGEPHSGGLALSDVRQALAVFARQPTMVALEISSYDPALDVDGESAKKLVELLVDILSPRLRPEEETPPAGETAAAAEISPGPAEHAEDSGVSAGPNSGNGQPATHQAITPDVPEPDAMTPDAPAPDVPTATSGEAAAGAAETLPDDGARGESGSVGNTPVERDSPQGVSIENSPVEDVTSGSDQRSSIEGSSSEESAVENPQAGVERETPSERGSHSTPPDSAPSGGSGADGSVERETP
jgi:arginase